jgi:hypothetical protein
MQRPNGRGTSRRTRRWPNLPLGRLGTGDDIAAACVFLCSDGQATSPARSSASTVGRCCDPAVPLDRGVGAASCCSPTPRPSSPAAGQLPCQGARPRPITSPGRGGLSFSRPSCSRRSARGSAADHPPGGVAHARREWGQHRIGSRPVSPSRNSMPYRGRGRGVVPVRRLLAATEDDRPPARRQCHVERVGHTSTTQLLELLFVGLHLVSP